MREYLLGPEKAALHLSPCVGTITIAKLPEEAALKFKTLHGRHTIHFHPHGYFSFIGGESTFWTDMKMLVTIPTHSEAETQNSARCDRRQETRRMDLYDHAVVADGQ